VPSFFRDGTYGAKAFRIGRGDRAGVRAAPSPTR
jgi:hypothetical protein